MVERELALLSASNLFGLTCFRMNLSIASFGDFTSDVLEFFNALAGEEGLELGVMLPSERNFLFGIGTIVLDCGCIGFLHIYVRAFYMYV